MLVEEPADHRLSHRAAADEREALSLERHYERGACSGAGAPVSERSERVRRASPSAVSVSPRRRREIEQGIKG